MRADADNAYGYLARLSDGDAIRAVRHPRGEMGAGAWRPPGGQEEDE